MNVTLKSYCFHCREEMGHIHRDSKLHLTSNEEHRLNPMIKDAGSRETFPSSSSEEALLRRRHRAENWTTRRPALGNSVWQQNFLEGTADSRTPEAGMNTCGGWTTDRRPVGLEFSYQGKKRPEVPSERQAGAKSRKRPHRVEDLGRKGVLRSNKLTHPWADRGWAGFSLWDLSKPSKCECSL